MRMRLPPKCCAKCNHFYQHYIKNPITSNKTFDSINCGHCVYPRFKYRKPTDVCEHFESKKPKEDGTMDMDALIERHALLQDGACYLARVAKIAKTLGMDDTHKHFLELCDAFKESMSATAEQIERLEEAERNAVFEPYFRSVM